MSGGAIQVFNVSAGLQPAFDWHFYCGRLEHAPFGVNARLGNPYRIDNENSRLMAIEKFANEFDNGETARSNVWRKAVNWLIKAVYEGERIALYCHCKPKACHCDIIQAKVCNRVIFPELTFYSVRP